MNNKRTPGGVSRTTGRFFLCLLTVFSIIYLIWRVCFTMPYGHRIVDLIFASVLLLVELLGIAEMAVHFALESRREPCPKTPEAAPSDLPAVDVLVPTRGEPKELVERTLRGCLAMEYPKGKLQVYLCDDAENDELRILSEELGVHYLAREDHSDAKAGNLNFAMKASSAPLIAVFDADMCPEPDFLQKTAPFFLTGKRGARHLDSRFGFVQTPQDFRDADLFQRAFRAQEEIPNEQDYFYLELEPARNGCNAVIFGGSNTLLSRHALEAAGGFATGTLTEDFATGIEIQKLGYRCVAIDTPLAAGLSPESLTAMIRQRTRWARGCIQAGRKTKILSAKGLSSAQRWSYLAAVIYWFAPFKRLVYLLAPLMFSVFGITVMNCDFKQMCLFWLPMYLLAVIGIRLFSGGIRTAKWSRIYELCLFPFLLPGVLAETLGFSGKEFVVTDKSGKDGWRFWYPLPHLLLIGLSVFGIYNTTRRIYYERTSIYLFLLVWLFFNLYELLYALLFVLSCSALPAQADRKNRLRRLPSDAIWRMTLIDIVLRIMNREKKEDNER